MARRKRRQPEAGEYEDPLSNYEPASYEDELERSLAEDEARHIEHTPVLTTGPDAYVGDVVKKMAAYDGAAVVVVDEEHRPVGIFSERDVLNRLAEDYGSKRELPIREVMTKEPMSVWATDTPSRVLNVMVSGGFRHIPLVDADGKLLGLIGARRVTAYLQGHLRELKR